MINNVMIVYVNLDSLCSCSSTSGTCVSLNTCAYTSSGSCYNTLIFFMVILFAERFVTIFSVTNVVVISVDVIESRNLYVSCVITSRAFYVCIPTDFCTSSIFAFYINEVMLKSLKNRLAFDVIATRAILVCGITVFSTSSILALYINEVMLKSLKNCLAFDVIATRAILVCGITVFCTSSILAFYINEVMLKSLKNSLAFDVIATRAILVCGVTGFGTSSVFTFYINEVMLKSLKNCLAFGVIATRAILMCGITVFSTSSSLAFYGNKIVIKSRNFLCVRIATFASECLNTCCCTCSGSCNRTFVFANVYCFDYEIVRNNRDLVCAADYNLDIAVFFTFLEVSSKVS